MNKYLVLKNESLCCGCRACEQVCPKSCISLVPNTEGFLYPICDEDQCISCGLCEKVCPFENVITYDNPKKVYASVSTDIKSLKISSSGGVFYQLAHQIIEQGGVVIGAAFDDGLDLNHRFATSLDDLLPLIGSKYIQSDTNDTFYKAKIYLNRGITVMFVGTPCQCAGIRAYLQQDYSNLLVCDFVCHGVPSKKLFEGYVKFLEKKHHGRLTNLIFRDKEKFGWSITLKYEIARNNKTKIYYIPAGLSPYFFAFLRGKVLRESCYDCPYAQIRRPSDITLADFWGIDKVKPGVKFENGCSCVLINTEKGERLYDSVGGWTYKSEVSLDEAVSGNINFISPSNRDFVRDRIYNIFNKKGFKYVATHYCKNPRRFKIMLKILLKKLKFNK